MSASVAAPVRPRPLCKRYVLKLFCTLFPELQTAFLTSYRLFHVACVTIGPSNRVPCTPPSRLHARLPLTLFVPPGPASHRRGGGGWVTQGGWGAFVVHSVWGNTPGRDRHIKHAVSAVRSGDEHYAWRRAKKILKMVFNLIFGGGKNSKMRLICFSLCQTDVSRLREEKDVGYLIICFPSSLRSDTEGGAWTLWQAPGCVGAPA